MVVIKSHKIGILVKFLLLLQLIWIQSYYVRMTYDLSTYRLYLSIDGEVYNEVGSKASTTIIYPMQINIGAAWESPRMYLEGSFYLNDCNIKIDGKEWWKPVLMENRDNYEYIISDNPNWTTDDLNNIKQVGIVDASSS